MEDVYERLEMKAGLSEYWPHGYSDPSFESLIQMRRIMKGSGVCSDSHSSMTQGATTIRPSWSPDLNTPN